MAGVTARRLGRVEWVVLGRYVYGSDDFGNAFRIEIGRPARARRRWSLRELFRGSE